MTRPEPSEFESVDGWVVVMKHGEVMWDTFRIDVPGGKEFALRAACMKMDLTFDELRRRGHRVTPCRICPRTREEGE